MLIVQIAMEWGHTMRLAFGILTKGNSNVFRVNDFKLPKFYSKVLCVQGSLIDPKINTTDTTI